MTKAPAKAAHAAPMLSLDNAFDAEGLTRLTEQTEARRKQRNDVEQDTEVQVRTKDLEATRQKLTIEKDQEFRTFSK